MALSFLDGAIIVLYFAASLGIGLYLSRRASRSTDDFFLGGRKLPWYVAGTSMVATTFAADTPLAVTELVAQRGIAGNWLWWNMLLGGMMTVFFFARLWRRSGIQTDAEFAAIRYSGRAGSFLRGFRALYVGVLMNTIVLAWVNLAMVKILEVMWPDLRIFGFEGFAAFGVEFGPHLLAVGLMMVFVGIYASLSGLMGVSLTDSFQFVMAMTGSIALAVVAVGHVGGMDALRGALSDTAWVFDFLPALSHDGQAEGSGLLRMSATALVAYLGVQWWASWYPGAEPGGGGYVAQRMMSAKDERHSLLATLWFQVAHYALRPWPWVLAALVALVLYPHEADKGATYVMLVRDLLPSGLLGLMLAAFLSAYMSTLASQTVWGTSYIVNDFVRPFVKPNAPERYYVRVSRWTTWGLMLFSLVVTTQFERVSDAWKFVLAMSAGIGSVLILRWFWWRVNAWSELSALVAPYLIYPALAWGLGWDVLGADFEPSLIAIALWSTTVWVATTLLTPPTDADKLMAFYRKVHPGGPGWRHVAALAPEVKPDAGYARLFANWLLGCVLVLAVLFGFGKLLFGAPLEAAALLALALLAAVLINRNFGKTGWA